MTESQEIALVKLLAKHTKCVEAAESYACNLQGPDTKRKLWKSLQEKEVAFERALKRAIC